MKRLAPSDLARELWETPLPEDEFERRLAAALAEEDEIARARELIAWFKRRYPTAGERLAYAKRKYAEWTRVPTGPRRP